MCRVLVLGMEKLAADVLVKALQHVGHKPHTVTGIDEAFAEIKDVGSNVDCVVIDETVPGIYRDFIQEVRKYFARMGVVVLTPNVPRAEDMYGGLDVWSVLPRAAKPDMIAEKVAGAYELAAMSDTKFFKLEREIGQAAEMLKSQTDKRMKR